MTLAMIFALAIQVLAQLFSVDGQNPVGTEPSRLRHPFVRQLQSRERVSDNDAEKPLIFLFGAEIARLPVVQLGKHVKVNQTELTNRQPNCYTALAL